MPDNNDGVVFSEEAVKLMHKDLLSDLECALVVLSDATSALTVLKRINDGDLSIDDNGEDLNARPMMIGVCRENVGVACNILQESHDKLKPMIDKESGTVLEEMDTTGGSH